MSRRISLREFQESLVRRLNESDVTDRRTLLGVTAGEQAWVLSLAEAGEILPVPPLAEVPLTLPYFRGLANVRGTLYGVIDFSAFNGGPLTPTGGQARLVLIGARHGINTALLVGRTTGLRNPDEFDTAPADVSNPAPWITQRLIDLQSRTWHQLDIPALLNQPSFLEVGVVE
ncbi:MAG: chemotaxis protein CheW [Zoogloeaceae bacterium]|nr:chemotaxis protein CheW [Zoogloeaceae bacterium]